MVSRIPELPPVQSVILVHDLDQMIHLTPPPLLLQPLENNYVTSIKAKTTCQNKQLTPPRLLGISHFEPGMQQFLGARDAQTAEAVIVSNRSCDCPVRRRAASPALSSLRARIQHGVITH
jgi:hypothetical protein